MSAALSDEFLLPRVRDVGGINVKNLDGPCTYLCGNSLGALAARSKQMVEEELDVWSKRAVVGHFDHPHGRQWVDSTKLATPLLAEILGANDAEVAIMGTLTANLHLTMSSFYKPNATRYKILCESHAFPSDQYAFQSQVRAHGLDPKDAIIEMEPRKGEFTLREEDILATIEREGSSIALVLFSGVQYYTGQLFPIQKITAKAQEQGCICGWDLAHATGNVPLSLHNWGVDFAMGCTYKYLNSGAGGIGFLYIHDKWNNKELPKYAGWWGVETKKRFQMEDKFVPIAGAAGFQQSNPSALCVAALLGSLEVFKKVGMMGPIRERSILLTNTLESLLKKSKFFVTASEASNVKTTAFTIITPSDPEARGAQLSLLFLPLGSGLMQRVYDYLVEYGGVIGDERRPDVIRLAPAPLYNTLADCEHAADIINEALGRE